MYLLGFYIYSKNDYCGEDNKKIFMGFWKSKAYNLTESDVRYAMDNSQSNMGASRFLKVSFPTYKKYAKMYIDKDTGKSLYDLHKNVAGIGISRKTASKYFGKKGLKEILEGKHPEYHGKRLKKRLIQEGYRRECCEMCGFDERRITDFTVPLILIWEDGDKTNHKDENLKLICYNCFYLTQTDLFNRRADRTDFKGYRDDD